MKQLYVLGAVFACGLSLSAMAGEKVDKMLAADGVNKIYVNNLRGKVNITGWSKEDVKVTGELDDEAQGLIFEKDGNVIKIKVDIPKNSTDNWGNKGSKLNINVPSNVRVEFKGVSSDFTLHKIDAGVEGKTVSGDLNITEVFDNVQVQTVSGEIVSRENKGKIYLSTVSGDIDDKNDAERLKVKSVSGDVKTRSTAKDVDLSVVSGSIRFTLATVEEFEVATVSGDIDGKLALSDNGRMEVSTVSGDVALTFTEELNAHFRLKAQAGGDLVNKITDDKAVEAKYGPSSKLTFDVGSGSAKVKGYTVSGTIRIAN